MSGFPSGIEKLTSAGGTVTITDPTGPVTDLAASGGTGPAPATTVTGPDSYGSPAVVGTGTTYARNDHDHGLPAAPAVALTNASGQLATDVSVPTTTLTTVLTTASLAVGTWLINASLYAVALNATTQQVDIKASVGTATATFSGGYAMTIGFPSQLGKDFSAAMTCTFIATVTVAGTLVFQAYASDSTGATFKAATALISSPGATGYTAVKIA